MADNYWRDPTGALRIRVPDVAYAGTRAVELDLAAYQIKRGHAGERFFVRAFAQTRMLSPANCASSGTSAQDFAMRTGQCVRRYALTNPVWAVNQSFGQCPKGAAQAIDGDRDGLPDGCDPCPKTRLNVCQAPPPPREVLASPAGRGPALRGSR